MAERPLGIVQINTLGNRGGASQVAWNLHDSYLRQGLYSYVVVGWKLRHDPNVIVHRFIPEEELLGRMQGADVSLSIMDDTIDSNVITTSLACGLPQVVSDVGSIRDYCSEKNAIFCNDVESFVEAMQTLSQNPTLCQEMRHHARKKAETISLEQSINWYRDLFSGAPVKC